MPQITSLSVQLQGDASSLIAATKQGINSIADFGRQSVRWLGGPGGQALAQGAQNVASTVLDIGNAARASVGGLGEFARSNNLTLGQAQKLKFVADQTGNSLYEMERAIKAAGSAADLLAVGPELEATTDATEKAALGAEIFGDKWTRVADLFRGDVKAFTDAEKIFDGMGLGLAGAAGEGDAFADSLGRVQGNLDAIIGAFRDQVWINLEPQLAGMAKGAADLATALIQSSGGGEKFAGTVAKDIADAIKGVIVFFTSLGTLARGLWVVLEPIWNFIKLWLEVGAGVVAGLNQLARGNFSESSNIGGQILSKIGDYLFGEEQLDENKKQTQLLRDISDKAFSPAFAP